MKVRSQSSTDPEHQKKVELLVRLLQSSCIVLDGKLVPVQVCRPAKPETEGA